MKQVQHNNAVSTTVRAFLLTKKASVQGWLLALVPEEDVVDFVLSATKEHHVLCVEQLQALYECTA